MGLFFQPGNLPFSRISSKEYYVDRTAVIGEINRQLDKGNNLICLSLPRRSGKTWQYQSLVSYYDDSCDSSDLFEGFAISKDATFKKHMNQYIAIRLDMAILMADVLKKGGDIRSYVEECLKKDALLCFPDLCLSPDWDISIILSQIVEQKGKLLFFFIDEWDAPIRMAAENPDEQMSYLNLLRSWFKNGFFTESFVAGAYMTGILPIKKIKGESALSDFKEYTILEPGFFAPYIGFHEEEVRSLCEGRVCFEQLKDWYDGYTALDWHYYNPYAVIQAIDNGKVGNYWPATSAAESLTDYLKLNYDGLQEAAVALTGGARLLVDTSKFQNDTVRFRSKEDVLTLLIHLGYLTYDSITAEDMRNWNEKEKEEIGLDSSFVWARIPNLELRKIFRDLLDQNKGIPELVRFMKSSVQLLKDTEAMDSKAVAQAFHKLHATNYAPRLYNNEQSLRSLIRIAYIAYLDEYYKLEEIPSGKGIADIIFIPMQGSRYLPMIVELKWNRSTKSALTQILQKEYHSILVNTSQDILFVGINYDTNSGAHSCKITKIRREGAEYRVVQESEMATA